MRSPSPASEHHIGNVSRIQSPHKKIFLRAREFFPDSQIFILIPGTLHALLAQRINNAAICRPSGVQPGAGLRRPPGGPRTRRRGPGARRFRAAAAWCMLSTKLREMAEALLH